MASSRETAAERLTLLEPQSEFVWFDVCAEADVLPGTGVAALLRGEQVAIVRSGDGQTFYAVSNFDPFSQAFVIARGIVGDRGGVPKIASPIYKQSFDLRTGQCLDDPAVGLSVYRLRRRSGRIELALPVEVQVRA